MENSQPYFRRYLYEKKLDAIFKAFQPYIRQQDWFDIVYSEKYGYVRISVEDEEGLKILDTPKKMLDVLFNDIIDDVVFSSDNPQKSHMEFELTEYAEAEGRRRIMAILETMEDEDKLYYLKYLDMYLETYQEDSVQLECDDDDN